MADTTGLWTSEYFYREAAKIGPATRKVIVELISARAIPAQAFQSCRNVLNMGKHANKAILEQACARLIAPDGTRRAVSYTAVKKHDGCGTQRPINSPDRPRSASRNTT
ncbi:hypothetical protein KFR76_02825 [Corynebacterium diphtheriae]|nr:hypothetical protein KFR76_02825 [Corynebacterium diphtheriae]